MDIVLTLLLYVSRQIFSEDSLVDALRFVWDLVDLVEIVLDMFLIVVPLIDYEAFVDVTRLVSSSKFVPQICFFFLAFRFLMMRWLWKVNHDIPYLKITQAINLVFIKKWSFTENQYVLRDRDSLHKVWDFYWSARCLCSRQECVRLQSRMTISCLL